VVAVRQRAAFLVIAGSMLLTGCQATGGSASPGVSVPQVATPSSQAPSSQVAPPLSPSTTAPATTSSTAAASGKVVVLDAGHNGGNSTHVAEINKLVPAGRGETKPCNTTGTSTNGGYTEHAFTFDVTQRVGAALTAKGVKVVYTRTNDTGVGPCVDKRAAVGNAANVSAVISIHGDGSTSAGAHGFHVAYSSPPLNAQQGEPSTSLAKKLRDGMRSAGFTSANYIGQDGLSARSDLAGLNLSTRPSALIECGNMRNASEAAEMSSAEGRQHYAAAIAAAVEAYLEV
jgi:N-acetylmuramoyl-L-alanine amidase